MSHTWLRGSLLPGQPLSLCRSESQLTEAFGRACLPAFLPTRDAWLMAVDQHK